MKKEIGDLERQSGERRGEKEAERRGETETVSGSLSNSAHIPFTDIQATGGDGSVSSQIWGNSGECVIRDFSLPNVRGL